MKNIFQFLNEKLPNSKIGFFGSTYDEIFGTDDKFSFSTDNSYGVAYVRNEKLRLFVVDKKYQISEIEVDYDYKPLQINEQMITLLQIRELLKTNKVVIVNYEKEYECGETYEYSNLNYIFIE